MEQGEREGGVTGTCSAAAAHAKFRKQLPAAATAAAAQAHEVSTDAAHLSAVTQECSRLSAALEAHAGVVSSGDSSSVRVCLAPTAAAHSWQRLLVEVPLGYPQQLPTLVFEHHPQQQQPVLAQVAWDAMQLRVWEGTQLATLQQVAECWLDVVGSMGA